MRTQVSTLLKPTVSLSPQRYSQGSPFQHPPVRTVGGIDLTTAAPRATGDLGDMLGAEEACTIGPRAEQGREARRGQRAEQGREAGHLIHQWRAPIHHPGMCSSIPLFFVHFGCTWGIGVHRLDLKHVLLFLCSNEHFQ
jgi:hypothetical protein